MSDDAPEPRSDPAPPDAGAAPADAGVETVVAPPSFVHSLRGLWHLTTKAIFAWRRLPLLAVAILANPLLAWLSVPLAGTEMYLEWITRLHFGLLVPLLCLVVCGGMIRDEMQEETLPFLLTRPLTRARLYLGKYLCQLVWLEVLVLVNSALLTAVGLLCRVPEAPGIGVWAATTGVPAVMVYSALGGLFGLITRRYIVLGIVYGFLVEIGIGHIPTNIHSLSMARHIQTLMAGNAAIREHYGWTAEGAWTAALIMLVATGLALAAGAALFTLREFHTDRDAPR